MRKQKNTTEFGGGYERENKQKNYVQNVYLHLRLFPKAPMNMQDFFPTCMMSLEAGD